LQFLNKLVTDHVFYFALRPLSAAIIALLAVTTEEWHKPLR
jgi:hypothetical protein